MPVPIPRETVELPSPDSVSEEAEPGEVTFADLERVLADDAQLEAVLATWDGFL